MTDINKEALIRIKVASMKVKVMAIMATKLNGAIGNSEPIRATVDIVAEIVRKVLRSQINFQINSEHNLFFRI
jgi:hypothetical protein